MDTTSLFVGFLAGFVAGFLVAWFGRRPNPRQRSVVINSITCPTSPGGSPVAHVTVKLESGEKLDALYSQVYATCPPQAMINMGPDGTSIKQLVSPPVIFSPTVTSYDVDVTLHPTPIGNAVVWAHDQPPGSFPATFVPPMGCKSFNCSVTPPPPPPPH